MSQWTRELGEISSTLQVAETNGMDDEFWARFRSEKTYAQLFKRLIRCDGIQQLPANELAILRALGPRQYFGLREWSRLYWALPTRIELDNFPSFRWPLAIFNKPCPFFEGKKIKDTHSVFLTRETFNGEAATLERLAKWQRGKPKVWFDGDFEWSHREEEEFRYTSGFRWHLVVTEPVFPSLTYEEQLSRVPPEYEVMNFRDAVFHVIAYCHLRDRLPFLSFYRGQGRTATVHPYSNEKFPKRLSIWDDGISKIGLGYSIASERREDTGVFLCRKPSA